jgi:hypothetical protein
MLESLEDDVTHRLRELTEGKIDSARLLTRHVEV